MSLGHEGSKLVCLRSKFGLNGGQHSIKNRRNQIPRSLLLSHVLRSYFLCHPVTFGPRNYIIMVVRRDALNLGSFGGSCTDSGPFRINCIVCKFVINGYRVKLPSLMSDHLDCSSAGPNLAQDGYLGCAAHRFRIGSASGWDVLDQQVPQYVPQKGG